MRIGWGTQSLQEEFQWGSKKKMAAYKIKKEM
jgi:hypothetical protein